MLETWRGEGCDQEVASLNPGNSRETVSVDRACRMKNTTCVWLVVTLLTICDERSSLINHHLSMVLFLHYKNKEEDLKEHSN